MARLTRSVGDSGEAGVPHVVKRGGQVLPESVNLSMKLAIHVHKSYHCGNCLDYADVTDRAEM